jgi:outer membrane scaffolding protein for murein synthesis (MipA/OmpV family)
MLRKSICGIFRRNKLLSIKKAILFSPSFFAVGLIVPLFAFAELSNDTVLGPGLRSQPAYDGSASQHVEFVPVVRYLGQPWFVRSTQGVLEGGVRMKLAPGLHVGAQLAYEPGREASESVFLRNHSVSSINPGVSIGAHLEWDQKIGPMPITLLVRARQNTDFDMGAQVDFRLSAGVFQSGRVAAGVFTQATWADSKSTSSFYAVTPPQSGVTGLPAFTAGSGWLFGSFGLLWSVDLTRNWVVLGSMEARHLQGDAVSSPLTERSTNYYVAAGIAYRF